MPFIYKGRPSIVFEGRILDEPIPMRLNPKSPLEISFINVEGTQCPFVALQQPNSDVNMDLYHHRISYEMEKVVFGLKQLHALQSTPESTIKHHSDPLTQASEAHQARVNAIVDSTLDGMSWMLQKMDQQTHRS
jgi:hypothetical protein